MAWQEPKINWKVTDYYTFSDFQRLLGNIDYLKSYQDSRGQDTSGVQSIDTSEGVNTIPYVEIINVLESNLGALAELFNMHEHFDQVTWYSVLSDEYIRNPSYVDWIRWEQITQLLYDSISAEARAYNYSNEFYSGEV